MIKKILIPGDPVLFKQALLKTKCAKRTIIYKDGSEKVEWWDAYKFTPSSNLMGNISSQLWHRRDKAEIIEAIYEIAEEENNSNRLHDIEDTNSGELYIHYKKGWESFRPVGEHVVEYAIENDKLTIICGFGFGPGKTYAEKISAKDMRELICILNSAVAMNAFEKSNTTIQVTHGTICSYDYDYKCHSGRECGSLFASDTLNSRYADWINRILK